MIEILLAIIISSVLFSFYGKNKKKVDKTKKKIDKLF